MAKVIFIPISLAGSLLAGFAAKKIFDQIWGVFDEEEPPDSGHRDISLPKLIVAAALQGAIFRVAKETSDHYGRRAFATVSGSWPGQERPEPE
jgi:hypothetical protein